MIASAVAALDSPSSSTVRNSVIVAGWGLVSRATGLLRVVATGAVLGPTYFANAFQTGYVVPHLVCVLIAGPVLSMVLVPGVVRAIGAGGVDGGRELSPPACHCWCYSPCSAHRPRTSWPTASYDTPR